MIKTLLIDLADLLRKQGENIAQDLRDGLPVASGELKESVKSKVALDGAVVSLTVSADERFRFTELGRRPRQKQPPLKALEPWLKIRGIPAKAAYPIARAIGIRGIKGRHLLPGIIARREKDIRAIIKRTVGEAVKVEAQNLIKRSFEKKAA